MSIKADGFSLEMEQAKILADAQASDVPEVVALEDRLREGQIYLSIGEVFSTELVNNAFVSNDGVDLRGPLAIENLRTAVNLCNWLDTDTILRTCWSLEPTLAQKLADVAEFPVKDRAWVSSVFARLERENPPPKSEAEALARYNDATPQPRMLSSMPANLWLLPQSQLALRIWFITRIARDHTAMDAQLDETWYNLANKRENMTRAEFARAFQVDLDGVGAVERGMLGIGGNLLKDISNSISRLFKDAKKWFSNALKEFGKLLASSAEPLSPILDWIGKQVGMPALFKHPVRLLVEALGRLMEKGRFDDERVMTDLGNHLTQAGAVLAAVAGVIGAVFPPVGAALGAIAALMVAVGQGILAIYRVMREQALARALNKAIPIPKTPAQTANAASNAGELEDTGAQSSGGGGGLLALLALGALGGR